MLVLACLSIVIVGLLRSVGLAGLLELREELLWASLRLTEQLLLLWASLRLTELLLLLWASLRLIEQLLLVWGSLNRIVVLTRTTTHRL